MARDVEIKTKTFFQIPPKNDPFDFTSERVVFMDIGLDLRDINLITECVQVGELWYQFTAHVGYGEDRKVNFDFKRKGDCLMAQRELSRAWTHTGEFAYDSREVDAGEGSDY